MLGNNRNRAREGHTLGYGYLYPRLYIRSGAVSSGAQPWIVGSLLNWAYGLCWLRRVSGFEHPLIPPRKQQIALWTLD